MIGCVDCQAITGNDCGKHGSITFTPIELPEPRRAFFPVEPSYTCDSCERAYGYRCLHKKALCRHGNTWAETCTGCNR